MALFSPEISEGAAVISQAMKAVRRKRGLRLREVAEQMGMAQRSYELFEAGQGKITVERVHAFAQATDCDPYALMLAPRFGSDFAVDCADTKLVLIMIMSLEQFAQDRGNDIAYLEPPHIIAAFQRLFKDLGAKLDDNEAFLTAWLNGGSGILKMGQRSLRGLRRKKG